MSEFVIGGLFLPASLFDQITGLWQRTIAVGCFSESLESFFRLFSLKKMISFTRPRRRLILNL